MKLRLEFSSGSSSKFWEIVVDGASHTVTYGRIGTAGQSRAKAFADGDAAQAAAETLIAQKRNKGYVDAPGAPAPAASKKATSKKATTKKATTKKATTKKATTKKATTKKATTKKATTKKATTKKATSAGSGDQARFVALCLESVASSESTWRHRGETRSFSVEGGAYREFAFWRLAGEQVGMHVRYGDPTLVDDPRYEPSTARGTSNWLHILPGDHDWEEIERLVIESHTIAQQRGGGHLAAKKLYFPLKKGYEAAAELARPQSLHAGGPAAKILSAEGPAAFRLSLWAAEQVAPLVPKKEKAALDGELERLRGANATYDEITATHSDTERRMYSGYEKLREVSKNLYQQMIEGDSLAVACARGCNETFRDIPGGYSQRALSDAGVAIVSAVQALAEGRGDDAVTDFLVALDERVMIEEFNATCLAKTKQPAPAIAKVLWRGADDKGYPAFWIVRAGERYAFLGKIGRRWGLQEGDLDSVLALVPDALFEAAAMMVYERDDKRAEG
jgi:predicted DNA-binding WGR domain protein